MDERKRKSESVLEKGKSTPFYDIPHCTLFHILYHFKLFKKCHI